MVSARMTRFLTPAEDRLIARFLDLLAQRLPEGALRSVTLFGSRARGASHEASDIDVAVEVVPEVAALEARRAVADAAHDAMAERDAFALALSPVVVPAGQGGALGAALARDGERLWPRAA
jgi:predicted nucleotidyltransferase